MDEIPFESERMYMATLHVVDGKTVAYVKGAAEKLLSLSKSLLKENEVVPLTEADSQAIIATAAAMAQDALRVNSPWLMLNCRITRKSSGRSKLKSNLVFVGLAAMADPPREEAREAIRLMQTGRY